ATDEVDDEEFQKILRSLVRDTFFDIVNDPVFGARLLKSPFYFFTQPIHKRQILDSELFQVHNDFPFDVSHGLIITPFFMQTNKVCYTENKTGIESYVDIHQQGLIQTLDDLQFTQTVLPDFLALFSQLKLQERKVGAVFSYQGLINKTWQWQIQLPVVYQEYNYYLSGSERAALKDFFTSNQKIAIAAPATEGSGSGGAKGIIKFIRHHLISDKIGLSDLKVLFKKKLKETDWHSLSYGAHIIIPVAFPIKQGLIGTRFNTSKKRPNFDLHTDLVDLYADGYFDTLKTNALNLGIEMLDRISTILIEQQLGNRRHFVLGLSTEFQQKIDHNKFFYTHVETELLMPMIEKRFIKKNLDTVALNTAAEDNPVTQQQARADVDILSLTFLDKMFPERYALLVFPGIKIQATSAFSIDGKRWKSSLGCNFWFQSSEHLYPSEQISDTTLYNLDAAKKGSAVMHKLFIACERINLKNSNWHLKFHASTTLYSYGIGKELTLSMSVYKLF
ncbi:hypothetical protein EBU24_01690, partial [bacterium]|nr:hypothetical protein [bacterium]